MLIELRDGEPEMIAAGLLCRAATLARLAARAPARAGSRQLRDWAARHLALAARISPGGGAGGLHGQAGAGQAASGRPAAGGEGPAGVLWGQAGPAPR